MQNPVENLEPGTRLVFTVKDQSTEVVLGGGKPVAGGGGVRELGWGMIHVDRSTMSSQVGNVQGVIFFVFRGEEWGGGCYSDCYVFLYRSVCGYAVYPDVVETSVSFLE